MLDLVKQLNDAKFGELFRFEIADKHIGYVRPELAQALIERAPDFLGQTGPQTLAVIAEGLSPQQLTERFKKLDEDLAADGILPKPAAESTDVRARITDAPLCQINRNLIFPLGIISRGVHVILTHENGDFVVAKRSDKVFTFQGAYDVPVGGLLPSGKDPWNYVKVEAAEEASLGEGSLKPGGDAIVLAYARNVQGTKDKPAFPFETDGGTNWDEVFYWTAVIPDGVTPTPRDGEVKSFQRMSPAALIDSLRTEPQNWKTNSGVMFLEALARDPRYSNLFTPDEHKELKALLIADPRPPESRGELPASAHKAAVVKRPGL